VRKDNPEVDGAYEPIYFDRNDGTNALINVAAFGLAPVLLPAIGAAVGHLVMRRPLKQESRVALGPPTLSMSKSASNPKAVDMTIRLISGTF
jgi:hypothetical protein